VTGLLVAERRSLRGAGLAGVDRAHRAAD
jgi:hypothetical protein